MNALRIATARVADLAAVMQVMDAAFDPAFGEAWSRAQVLTLFALPSARVSLAWDGEAPCGFSAARVAGPESELLLLAVDPGWRGRGVGRALMADWQDWAAVQGPTNISSKCAPTMMPFTFIKCAASRKAVGGPLITEGPTERFATRLQCGGYPTPM